MGGNNSVISPIFSNRYELDMCVSLVLPLYYTRDAVTPENLVHARASWNLILSDEAPGFARAKADPNFTEISCLTYFYTSFYNRLFDVHPACRPLFKGNIQIQGKALAKIISFLLKDHHDDEALFVQVLVDLADRHINTYHVKAHEYGILGEVLLYALAKCVGAEKFDLQTTIAWVRLYSMVISIVVPLHVEHELNEAHAHGRSVEVASTHNTISLTNPSRGSVSMSSMNAESSISAGVSDSHAI